MAERAGTRGPAKLRLLPEDKRCGGAKELEAVTRQVCGELVKTSLAVDYSNEVGQFLRLALASESRDLLDALEQVIRQIRAAAAEGRWMYHGDNIVFSVRPSAGAVQAVQQPPSDAPQHTGPFGSMDEWLVAAVGDVLRQPVRIVLDDERPPPMESGAHHRLPQREGGLPRTDVLRKKLAAQWGASFKHKEIAALTILLQPPAFFREAFAGGATRPKDVLKKELQAIKAACHRLGIKRSAKGRPPGGMRAPTKRKGDA